MDLERAMPHTLPPMHPAALLIVRYRKLVEHAANGAGIYAVLVGGATWWSGDARLTGPSYRTAVELSEVAGMSPSVLWGLSVVIFGVLALLPWWKVSQCGLYGIVAWSLALGGSFLVSVNVHPLAGWSGVFAHFFIGVVVMGLLMVRFIDRPRPHATEPSPGT